MISRRGWMITLYGHATQAGKLDWYKAMGTITTNLCCGYHSTAASNHQPSRGAVGKCRSWSYISTIGQQTTMCFFSLSFPHWFRFCGGVLTSQCNMARWPPKGGEHRVALATHSSVPLHLARHSSVPLHPARHSSVPLHPARHTSS